MLLGVLRKLLFTKWKNELPLLGQNRQPGVAVVSVLFLHWPESLHTDPHSRSAQAFLPDFRTDASTSRDIFSPFTSIGIAPLQAPGSWRMVKIDFISLWLALCGDTVLPVGVDESSPSSIRAIFLTGKGASFQSLPDGFENWASTDKYCPQEKSR